MSRSFDEDALSAVESHSGVSERGIDQRKKRKEEEKGADKQEALNLGKRFGQMEWSG